MFYEFNGQSEIGGLNNKIPVWIDSMWVYVHVYAVCVCVCVHKHTCEGQRAIPSFIPQVLSTLYSEAGVLILELVTQARSGGQEAAGIHCLHFPRIGITTAHHWAWLFCVGSEEQTHIFSKASTLPMVPLPSPLFKLETSNDQFVQNQKKAIVKRKHKSFHQRRANKVEAETRQW